MRHRIRPSLARFNRRLADLRLNKRLTVGLGAALLVTGAAAGTSVALTSGDSGSTHTAVAASSVQAVARPSSDAANRSEQRTALPSASADAAAAAAKAKAEAAAKATAAAKAKAEAAAQAAAAKAKAEAAAKAAAAVQAKAAAQAAAAAQAKAAAAAQAQAQAAAQAKAAAVAQAQAAAQAQAQAQAAATPSYGNNLDGWIAQAQSILAANGDQVPSAAAITARAMTESSGDPTVVNNWDSNAAAGTPSEGLMQVIQPTFDTYALAGHTDIMNPVDNIVAAVRYANATYGSFDSIAYGSSGY